jgi:hypothetical protein
MPFLAPSFARLPPLAYLRRADQNATLRARHLAYGIRCPRCRRDCSRHVDPQCRNAGIQRHMLRKSYRQQLRLSRWLLSQRRRDSGGPPTRRCVLRATTSKPTCRSAAVRVADLWDLVLAMGRTENGAARWSTTSRTSGWPSPAAGAGRSMSMRHVCREAPR